MPGQNWQNLVKDYMRELRRVVLCLKNGTEINVLKRNEKGKRTGLSHRGKWDVGVSSHVGSSYK